MNTTLALAWLRLFNDLPDELKYECRHEHAACSITSKGECLDEVIEVIHNLRNQGLEEPLLTPPAIAWLNFEEEEKESYAVPYYTGSGDRLRTRVRVEGSIPLGPRTIIRVGLPLLPAQRLAAEKARREMDDNEEDDNEEGC